MGSAQVELSTHGGECKRVRVRVRVKVKVRVRVSRVRVSVRDRIKVRVRVKVRVKGDLHHATWLGRAAVGVLGIHGVRLVRPHALR